MFVIQKKKKKKKKKIWEDWRKNAIFYAQLIQFAI